MVAPAAGAVVLVHFPFSDLSQAKLRPALVLADAGHGDRLFCQITSKDYGDKRAVELRQSAFASGSLHLVATLVQASSSPEAPPSRFDKSRY